MTEEQQKKELEIALTNYIALKHTQEECVGFIDGFKEALSLFAVSGTFCEKCNPNGIEDGNVIRCKKCGRGLALIEQNYH